MKNTSDHIPQEEVNSILEEYIRMLTRSGYSDQDVRKYITSGITGYERIKKKCKDEGSPIHRPGYTIKRGTYRKKLNIKTNWYKKTSTDGLKLWERTGGRNGCQFKQPSAPIFVPRTPGGKLAAELRDTENRLNMVSEHRVKIVEEGGDTIYNTLSRKNPLGSQKCENKKSESTSITTNMLYCNSDFPSTVY